MKNYDVVIVGAGPAGVGITSMLNDFGVENMTLLEKGKVGETFDKWPEEMRFITPSFTTNFWSQMDLNSIATGTSPAFTLETEHPTGKEYANYLRTITEHFELPVKENTNVLVQNSSAVFVISGTSGFEAILNDKPVFETRENVWSIMNLSKIIQSFENFADDLINEKNRIKKMNENDKKRIILSYLQSIEDSCFYATYPDILFYDRVGTEIEYEICGKELAKYFNKFINI